MKMILPSVKFDFKCTRQNRFDTVTPSNIKYQTSFTLSQCHCQRVLVWNGQRNEPFEHALLKAKSMPCRWQIILHWLSIDLAYFCHFNSTRNWFWKFRKIKIKTSFEELVWNYCAFLNVQFVFYYRPTYKLLSSLSHIIQIHPLEN